MRVRFSADEVPGTLRIVMNFLPTLTLIVFAALRPSVTTPEIEAVPAREMRSEGAVLTPLASLRPTSIGEIGRGKSKEFLDSLDVRVPVAQQSPAEQAFRRAVNAFQSGLYYEAEEAFRASLAGVPKNANALQGLAMCYFYMRRFDPCLETFKEVLALPKPTAEHYSNYGSVLEEIGKADLARPNFEKAIALDPKFAMAYFGLGRIQSRLGEVDAARKNLEKCLEIAPKNAEALYELADLEFRGQKVARAEELVRKALLINSRHVGGRFLLARAVIRSGKKDEGEKMLREARELQKAEDARSLAQKKIGSLLELAFGSMRSRKVSEAIGYFAEILKLDPSHAQTKSALQNLEQDLRRASMTAEADACKRVLESAK